jgi:hypothetical protein
MLKIDLPNRRMVGLSEETLQSANIMERYDLQDLIAKNPEEFFKDLGEDLFLIGTEIKPSDKVADSIDLLALDLDGNSVVIELKRDKHKLHLLQAIPYAGMVARWVPSQFWEILPSERQKALLDFLDEVKLDEINQAQRIILVAEDYDWEVLITAEWLSENFKVDIHCVRLRMAVDSTSNSRYLSLTQVYPQPELEDSAPSRGRQRDANVHGGPQDWAALLDTIENPDLVSFVKEWISRGDKALLQCKRLVFPNHREKWRVNLSRTSARVMQNGRFKLADGVTDEDYWKKGLSDPQKVGVRRAGIRLNFTLTSRSDFDFFQKSLVGALRDIQLENAAPN